MMISRKLPLLFNLLIFPERKRSKTSLSRVVTKKWGGPRESRSNIKKKYIGLGRSNVGESVVMVYRPWGRSVQTQGQEALRRFQIKSSKVGEKKQVYQDP